MKLLLDQNLSPKLVARLADVYAESAHVFTLGLDRASDAQVWIFARENAYTIVTQDTDYSDLNALEGDPPKVVWIRRGNCSTGEIKKLLREQCEAIKALISDPTASLLALL